MNLKRGDQNIHVREIQHQLEQLGYRVGRFGMPFDDKLEIIIKAFQAEMEIPVNGIVGTETYVAIQKAVQELQSSQQSFNKAELPLQNQAGDFITGAWQQWRVACTPKLNARSGPGFDYLIDMAFPTNTLLSLHADYHFPIKFDGVGKSWLVVNYEGAAFFVRANSRFIEPLI